MHFVIQYVVVPCKLEKKRKLTIFGKCEVINTLEISKLIYTASILPLPPPNFIKEINKLIYNYLWGSRDRIKRNTLIGRVKSGGIGIVDIETKFNMVKDIALTVYR